MHLAQRVVAVSIVLVVTGCTSGGEGAAGALACRDPPTCQTQTHGTKCSFADWALPAQTPCGGYVGVELSCFDSLEVMYYAADTGAFVARVQESNKDGPPSCIEGPKGFFPALACSYPRIDDCRDAGLPTSCPSPSVRDRDGCAAMPAGISCSYTPADPPSCLPLGCGCASLGDGGSGVVCGGPDGCSSDQTTWPSALCTSGHECAAHTECWVGDCRHCACASDGRYACDVDRCPAIADASAEAREDE